MKLQLQYRCKQTMQYLHRFASNQTSYLLFINIFVSECSLQQQRLHWHVYCISWQYYDFKHIVGRKLSYFIIPSRLRWFISEPNVIYQASIFAFQWKVMLYNLSTLLTDKFDDSSVFNNCYSFDFLLFYWF